MWGYHEIMSTKEDVQYRGGTQITNNFFSHGTEDRHGTHDIPTYIMISPTVLNIPHGTQDNPNVLMISPTVLNTPTVLSRVFSS